MLKIEIPDYVEQAVLQLEASGFEAYVVGGAVRDSLMGIEPVDWDITTDALTDDIKKIFKKHFDTGIKHGTVTVIVNNFPIEITTYRIDGHYSDSRHPDKVTFSKNIYDDLLRRDFTINALAYNRRTGVIDAYGGLADLRNGIIRCIGIARERFKEDALRILRALRFGATLNFEIDDTTYEAICSSSELLKNISGERICAEVTKLLMADRQIEKLFESGVGDVILPELSECFSIWQNNSSQIYDVGNHTLEVVYNVPKTPLLRYAALLHDVGKAKAVVTDKWGVDHYPGHANVSASIAREILTRFKMSNKIKFSIINLVRMHETKIKPDEVCVKRAISNLGKVEFIDLLALKRGNILGQNQKYINEKLRELDAIEKIYYEIIRKNPPLYVKDLAVDGNDMKDLGLRSSAIGKKLHMLLSHVIENPELNTREVLLEIAKQSEKGKN